MKIRPTFTITLETADRNESSFKDALDTLEIATRETNKISQNGYPIIAYTAPRRELQFLLIDFWDMDGEEAEFFIDAHYPND